MESLRGLRQWMQCHGLLNHWKKQCVPHYVKIVLTLWRNSGIILELSVPQFCYTSRALPQCGIISYCGNSEEIMRNQTMEKLWN